MTTVNLSPIFNGSQVFDATGLPLNAGKINSYLAGTSTPSATFTTNLGNVNNSNPIILGVDGRPPQEIWLDRSKTYKFVVTDSLNNILGTYDNIYGVEVAGSADTISSALTAYEADVASTATLKGAGLVGFNPTVNYAVMTLGYAEKQGYINIAWFAGADNTGGTDMTAIMIAAALLGHNIYIPKGTWAMNWVPTARYILQGDGSSSTFIKAFSSASAAISDRVVQSDGFWTYHSEIRNICFKGTGKTDVGFTFGRTDPTTYVNGDQLFNNVRFYGCSFQGLLKGVQFPAGNIGTSFYDCSFQSNFYGTYSINNKFSAAVMHAGNKYHYAGHFENNDCGVYIHNTQDGFGGYEFHNTIFESNKIAFYGYTNNTFNPPAFDRCWFELNGVLQGGSTTIDQWTGAVKSTSSFTNHSLIVDGTTSTWIINGGGIVGDINLIATSSRIQVDNTRVESQSGFNSGPCIVADSKSQIIINNPETDGGVPHDARVFITGNFYSRSLSASTEAGRRWGNFFHRFTKVASYGGSGAVQKCTGVVTTTGLAVVGTLVSDAIIYTQSNQFSVAGSTAGQTATIPSTAVTPTANDFVVLTFDVKWVSGVAPVLGFGDLSLNQVTAGMTPPETGVWYTLGGIGQSVNAVAQSLSFAGNASASVFNLSAIQIRSFPTRHEAQAFLTASVYVES